MTRIDVGHRPRLAQVRRTDRTVRENPPSELLASKTGIAPETATEQGPCASADLLLSSRSIFEPVLQNRNGKRWEKAPNSAALS